MKTEELTALGLNEDQVKQVFALNGKDVEAAKAAKDKTIADLTAERDGLKTRLDTAETTLKKFEGIDAQQIQQDGAFFGFDDFMKVAKQKDAGLYQTAEEKEAAEKAAKQKEKAPAFTGPTGDPGTGSERYTPPKIF